MTMYVFEYMCVCISALHHMIYIHTYIPMLLCDLHIRRCTGFLAEGLKGRPSNEMVAIKTHEGNGDWDAAIFLIRNPYKAIVSYFTWMATGSHTKTRSGCCF